MLPGDNYSGAEMSDDDTDWSSVEGREGKGFLVLHLQRSDPQ